MYGLGLAPYRFILFMLLTSCYQVSVFCKLSLDFLLKLISPVTSEYWHASSSNFTQTNPDSVRCKNHHKDICAQISLTATQTSKSVTTELYLRFALSWTSSVSFILDVYLGGGFNENELAECSNKCQCRWTCSARAPFKSSSCNEITLHWEKVNTWSY